MIHNRYLSERTHRLCNVVVGLLLTTTACLYINAYVIPARFQMLGLIVGGVVTLSVTLGLALVDPKRFSIMEGVAGGLGYDELDDEEE
ncbi:MAG: hypothetical protein JW888_14530 [Pirellulales bacterium]|nr:hypothetical protein [Pirellulales bacterium]